MRSCLLECPNISMPQFINGPNLSHPVESTPSPSLKAAGKRVTLLRVKICLSLPGCSAFSKCRGIRFTGCGCLEEKRKMERSNGNPMNPYYIRNYIYNSSHLFPLLTVELACASSPVGREFAASPSPYSRACFRILSRWSSLLAHPRRRNIRDLHKRKM
uniref:Uncharacterized protein n=1 Tax=Picea glauca TaxID=3330 RepID=A0A101M3D8_PICGL|nr:hypothetical protein ABT39_MTgene118 [Picea glauca]